MATGSPANPSGQGIGLSLFEGQGHGRAFDDHVVQDGPEDRI
jgi:hypothetical protein